MTRDRGIAVIDAETARRVGKRCSIESLSHDALRAALRLWNETRKQRPLPSKAEMTPKAMKSFLRNVTLFAIAADGQDF